MFYSVCSGGKRLNGLLCFKGGGCTSKMFTVCVGMRGHG